MRFWKCLALLCLLLMLALMPAQAQEETPPTETETSPLTIEIGIYVIGISEFQLEDGIYAVDFYLTLHCSRPCSDEELAMDIIGSSGTFSLNQEDRIRREDYAEYRYQAILSQNEINLRRFPFDRHRLNIILEAKFLTSDQVIFAEHPTENGVDSDVNLPSWEIDHSYQIALVDKHYYGAEEGYSRYVFSMELYRAETAAFIRSILPALVIVLISLISNFMPDMNQRSGITGGIILALLLHHLSVAEGIPQVAYAVYFDSFMLVNNALILMQFAFTVIELVLHKRGVAAAKLDYWSNVALALLVLVWIAAQAILVGIFIL